MATRDYVRTYRTPPGYGPAYLSFFADNSKVYLVIKTLEDSLRLQANLIVYKNGAKYGCLMLIYPNAK